MTEECVPDDAHEGPVGMAGAMKNRMVFRKDGWLLAADVNGFADGGGTAARLIGFRVA